jgi:dethiobiotin synthetase
MAGFFITGTDTGVGKTWATLALMDFLQARGLAVIGMKPVASGCFRKEGELRNEDALLLMENASLVVDYSKLNIYAFEQPASPHIAASCQGETVEIAKIVLQCRDLESVVDCVLVEGIGGWEVPLNDSQRVSHLACSLQLPVILVVGMRLGCLNHAFLTHDAMIRSGVVCAGWIANCIDEDFPNLVENLATLASGFSFPCLGMIPFCAKLDDSVATRFTERDFFRANCEETLLRLLV